MAVQHGRAALQGLKSFRAKNWFNKAFISFASDVASKYGSRNEILHGCLIEQGTAHATQLNFDNLTAGEVMINGVIMSMAVISATDTNAASVSAPILGMIWSSGTTGSTEATGLNSGTYAYKATMIVCDSNGGGASTSAPDGKVASQVVIISGSANASLGTAYPTSQEIAAALVSSEGNGSTADHSGVNGWVRLADITWSSGVNTWVSNRNNHGGK